MSLKGGVWVRQKKVRGIAEHRDTVMKIRIKGTSVLDGDISAPFYNSALRTLATRLAPCPPWPTGNWIIPQWENFTAQEGQNPAVLIRSSCTDQPGLLPCLSPAVGLIALHGQPRLTLRQSKKGPAWKTDTRRNSEDIEAMKLVGKLVLKNTIFCLCWYPCPPKERRL